MKTLCGMSTDELASSHLKEERKRIRDESYAGHLRQEDEGNEIVYKDGALQKIDKVKAEAAKQVRCGVLWKWYACTQRETTRSCLVSLWSHGFVVVRSWLLRITWPCL